ncbi:flavin-containing monooxygenase [Indioceanicola profundi]|uniref:flavin-containing monooxygenase n=1 Tax=Indioceanicola profundi TaxID=2220096 RepID=UPI000E6AB7F1|nr:NAD(P)/FAD-dependent oxidoreductase [Indioceanicola profundi]
MDMAVGSAAAESPAEAPGAPGGVQHFDVLIVGAGLSGIGAGYYLQTECPNRSYAILEGRHTIGGTWDLFRYPGIRSDSDMYTLGYSFRPWLGGKAFADGPSIRDYVRETAAEHGIDRKIRFGHRVTHASWSTADALWTVQAEVGPDNAPARFTCNFLYVCSGYYDYDEGYMPGWDGMERFGGRIVHPQKWPEELDYSGKRVVVIGSGATAVTLVPEMAKRAAHVTMLQRSPTYIVARPGEDKMALWLQKRLPSGPAHRMARWKNVLLSMYFYNISRFKPDLVKRMILKGVQAHLGPGHDVEKHFTPSYNPWDQRLCLVPDADLFKSIRDGKASVVTDQIDSFTETGLRLRSGGQLDADVVVTATGLKLKMMGGMRMEVDGRPVEMPNTLTYKGMMFSDIPNLAAAIGYTNASWTLKCELTSEYVCRLLKHMDARGYAWCVPRRPAQGLEVEPAINLNSGYVQRASSILPKQGTRKPWRLNQNYALDMAALRYGTVEDGSLEFGRTAPGRRAA